MVINMNTQFNTTESVKSTDLDFLTRIQLDEINVLRNVIDCCRELLATTKSISEEQRKDALEELNDACEAYNRLIENIKQ